MDRETACLRARLRSEPRLLGAMFRRLQPDAAGPFLLLSFVKDFLLRRNRFPRESGTRMIKLSISILWGGKMLRCLRFSRAVGFGLTAVFLACTNLAHAQSTGTIQGTVTDPSGAAVPNAPVTINNASTGEQRSTATDSSGIYLVPSLPVGTYRVSVKAPGMSPMTATAVEVPV